jgi:alkylation response protein AidB-like acyl-CoA dehydrogenase
MGGENLHGSASRIANCRRRTSCSKTGSKLLSAFNTQRCLNPSISLGLAEGALEEAVKYVKERRAFGRAIGDFQGVRWKIAEMYRDIEASRSILYRACATADPSPTAARRGGQGHRQRDGAAGHQRRDPGDGGYGFTDEFPVSRFYRGARYGTLGGGTGERCAT